MNEKFDNQQAQTPSPTYNYVASEQDYTYSYLGEAANPKKEKKHKGVAIFVVLCMVLTPILGVAGGFFGASLVQKTLAGGGSSSTVNVSTIKTENGLTVSELSSLVGPTVVEITTESIAGNAFIQQYVESGAGSGVVLSEDGYIVTNNHVIEGATTVKVRLHDGTEYQATFVGTDKQTDLAVIKIDAQNLAFATLADSENVVVGQDVIAVGNPLGQLGGTITNGIISALDRDVTIDNQTMRLLQTNAAINPGNSGGGLFNANGELVGIVNAKSGGNNIEGLGFAIPASTVKRVADDLIGQGYVGGRISTGMTLINITDELTAMRYGVAEYGVYVYSVATDSSAETAGLRTGDKIVKINDIQVDDVQNIKDAFEDIGVGKTVTVHYLRDSKSAQTKLLLTELVPENVMQ